MRRATADAARYRVTLRKTQRMAEYAVVWLAGARARQDILIRELQDVIIRDRVAAWLDDVDDFQPNIGRENVIVDGHVDEVLLEARVADLLRRKPRLAKIPRITITPDP